MSTPNTPQSKSATPWILLGVFLAALLVIAVILFTRGLQDKPTDTNTGKTSEELAKEYVDAVPGATEEEALDFFNKELEQSDIDKLFDGPPTGDMIDPDSIVEYCDDGDIIYVDEEGNRIKVTPADAGKTDADYARENEQLIKDLQSGNLDNLWPADDNPYEDNTGSNTGSTGTGDNTPIEEPNPNQEPDTSNEGWGVASDNDEIPEGMFDGTPEPWYPGD